MYNFKKDVPVIPESYKYAAIGLFREKIHLSFENKRKKEKILGFRSFAHKYM